MPFIGLTMGASIALVELITKDFGALKTGDPRQKPSHVYLAFLLNASGIISIGVIGSRLMTEKHIAMLVVVCGFLGFYLKAAVSVAKRIVAGLNRLFGRDEG